MEELSVLSFYTNKALYLIKSLRDQDLSQERRLELAKLLRNRIQSMEQCVDHMIDRLDRDSRE